MPTISRCSSSWRIVPGIRRWSSRRWLSGSRRRLRWRRGCLMTPGFRRTGRTRLVSSASTRARWGRSVTVRSECRCTRSGRLARCRLGGRCICPRSGAMTQTGGAGRRSPTGFGSRPSRSSVSSWSSAPQAGWFRRCRCSAITTTAASVRCASGSIRPAASTCCPSSRRRRCSSKAPPSRSHPETPNVVPRPSGRSRTASPNSSAS